MPLFVARHLHRPESCPAAPTRGSLLVAQVSAAIAARYGVAIQAEAVIDDAHEILLVVEAADKGCVERFMGVFAPWGTVAVCPASATEQAVARGGCGTGQPSSGPARGTGQPATAGAAMGETPPLRPQGGSTTDHAETPEKG